MIILVVMVLGAAIGLLTRYTLPGREWVGLFLNPTAAAAAAGVTWVVVSLAGMSPDTFTPWLISLIAATVVAILLPRILRSQRIAADNAELARLMTPGQAAQGQA